MFIICQFRREQLTLFCKVVRINLNHFKTYFYLHSRIGIYLLFSKDLLYPYFDSFLVGLLMLCSVSVGLKFCPIYLYFIIVLCYIWIKLRVYENINRTIWSFCYLSYSTYLQNHLEHRYHRDCSKYL